MHFASHIATQFQTTVTILLKVNNYINSIHILLVVVLNFDRAKSRYTRWLQNFKQSECDSSSGAVEMTEISVLLREVFTTTNYF